MSVAWTEEVVDVVFQGVAVHRDLDHLIFRNPTDFSQQNTLILDVLQNVREDNEVEEFVLEGEFVSVEWLARNQTGYLLLPDHINPGLRYFESIQLVAKLPFRHTSKNCAIACADFQHSFRLDLLILCRSQRLMTWSDFPLAPSIRHTVGVS